jgi:putative ABC transport system permease protein
MVAEMIPMLRARLIAHNGLSLSVDQFSSPRAKRLLDREANMAIMADLHNRVVAEIAPADRDLSHPAISVERGIAELFALNLADRLVFDVQGQQMRFQITTIREVVWQSLQPNFFFIAQPWTEEQLPVTYLTSFHTALAAEETLTVKATLQAISPSMLWLDVRSLIAQLQQLMQQAGTAVSFLYGFALIASLLVVLSATLAAQEGRYQQWLVLRTLGASRMQLLVIGLSEYALIGLLAGTLASILAQITQALIAVYWLDLPPAWDIELWLLGWGMGVFTLLLVAYLAQSPLRKALGVR